MDRLRHLIRRTLEVCRLTPNAEFLAVVRDRHPAGDDLPEGQLVVVRGMGTVDKWAVFRCPGGCGEKLQLSLLPQRRPRWSVQVDWLGRPMITPSIRVTSSCRCHFHLRNGRVEWCPDSGHGGP